MKAIRALLLLALVLAALLAAAQARSTTGALSRLSPSARLAHARLLRATLAAERAQREADRVFMELDAQAEAEAEAELQAEAEAEAQAQAEAEADMESEAEAEAESDAEAEAEVDDASLMEFAAWQEPAMDAAPAPDAAAAGGAPLPMPAAAGGVAQQANPTYVLPYPPVLPGHYTPLFNPYSNVNPLSTPFANYAAQPGAHPGVAAASAAQAAGLAAANAGVAGAVGAYPYYPYAARHPVVGAQLTGNPVPFSGYAGWINPTNLNSAAVGDNANAASLGQFLELAVEVDAEQHDEGCVGCVWN